MQSIKSSHTEYKLTEFVPLKDDSSGQNHGAIEWATFCAAGIPKGLWFISQLDTPCLWPGKAAEDGLCS